MKDYLLILILTLGLVTAVDLGNVKQTKKTEVPAAVKEAFSKQFPGTTAKWKKEGDKYEANFKQQNHEMSAVFELNGTLVETEIEINVSELPPLAASYIKEHYKGATIKEASKITKASGVLNYEAEVKGKDLIFDASGNFFKEVKD